MNNTARYGTLAFASVLSLLYVGVFAPGPIAAIFAASDATMKLASLGLLGLAAGLFVIASLLLIRGGNEDGEP